MQKVDLNKVLEMLINEGQEEATGLVHEWLVQMSKSVHESLMQEDDAALGIEDDQDAIESEEFYSEAEDEEDTGAEAEELGNEPGAEAEETVEVNKADLEAVMDNLKAEFAALMGGEEVADDSDMDADFDMDAAPEAGVEADLDLEAGEPEVEESVFEAEEEEELEEGDEFADLEESFDLETVADPAMADGKEVGKGGKVTQNTKSPLPSHKVSDRAFKGEPVEIKATEHKGFEREAAPEVKAKPLLKNQVKKATDGRPEVSKEGDKSAMLNKKDGFGSDSPKSPLSGVKKGK